VAPGANWRLSVEHVRARSDDFAWAQVVLCQLETPLDTLELALGEARRRGLVTVLNPAPVREGISDEVWCRVDYLTPNEGEAARRAAAGRGPRRRERGVGTVTVPLAAQGWVACTAGENIRPAAYPVEAVDTPAAGDSFNGARGAAPAGGEPLARALRFASAA